MQGRVWKWESVKGSPGLVDPFLVLASQGLAPATELEGMQMPRNPTGTPAQVSPMCALMPPLHVAQMTEHQHLLPTASPIASPVAHPLFISNCTSKPEL